MRAWHFTGDTLRDGRPIPPDGYKLTHDGPVIPCESGLHASVDPFDALRHAPGPTLCLVEVGGTIVEHGSPVDKLACSERTIVVRADITDALRWYARQQALKVIHLWNPPDVVLDYLMTGDELLRDAARAARAAQDAAWDAAWDAARAAARAAAGTAAWTAARDAARDAAGTAARAAAWDAARAAARAAAGTAARDAAWDAAGTAAWTVARDAAQAEFNDMIRDMYADYLEN